MATGQPSVPLGFGAVIYYPLEALTRLSGKLDNFGSFSPVGIPIKHMIIEPFNHSPIIVIKHMKYILGLTSNFTQNNQFGQFRGVTYVSHLLQQ
jgi:hypothetical protein